VAIDYSGSGQYHVTSSTPVTQSPLTMACWFNSDSATATQVLCSVAHSTSTGLVYFTLEAAGAIAGDPIRHRSRNGPTGTVDSTTGYTAGQWHHACAVVASTTSRAAYIDGGSKGTNSTSVSSSSALDRIGLGCLAIQTATTLTNGRIAEVGIWNVALTDDQVLSLARGYSPLCVQPQGLVFYAPLVRNVQDVRGGLTLTATGSPTVADHCRIIYPHNRIVVPKITAAAGGRPARVIGGGIFV